MWSAHKIFWTTLISLQTMSIFVLHWAVWWSLPLFTNSHDENNSLLRFKWDHAHLPDKMGGGGGLQPLCFL